MRDVTITATCVTGQHVLLWGRDMSRSWCALRYIGNVPECASSYSLAPCQSSPLNCFATQDGTASCIIN
jgi:hypothetical protein